MEIKLYNTLSRSKETFHPQKSGEVGIYNCGPTLYDTPHLGNYRTFVTNDILRRVFEYLGYKVTQVMNVTDVDDKTIKRSLEEKISLQDLTGKYEKLFLEGLKSLNIQKPHKVLKATENIPQMIELINKLIDGGYAYAATDGVYMRIDKVPNYGELANLPKDFEVKERHAEDEYDKQNAHDFALWKFWTEADGEIYWPAPFGQGRPGWHIECSAMAMEALGETIDIHTGGSDLIFPHHTNEIAQAECATHKKFVNYWLHGGFMTIKEEKMSKSKGNIIKLEDIEDFSVSPLAYRYWLLTSHYHSPIDFGIEAVKAAQTGLIRLLSAISSYPEGGKIIPAYKQKFDSFISDDLDMPKAIALVWELLKDKDQSEADKRATVLDFDKVFGLDMDKIKNTIDEELPAEIDILAEARKDARQNKEWQKADALRQEIESRGFVVKDTEEGQVISKK